MSDDYRGLPVPDLARAFADLNLRVEDARLAQVLSNRLRGQAQLSAYDVIDRWVESAYRSARSVQGSSEQSARNNALQALPLSGELLDLLRQAFPCNILKLQDIVTARMHDDPDLQDLMEDDPFSYGVNSYDQRSIVLVAYRRDATAS